MSGSPPALGDRRADFRPDVQALRAIAVSGVVLYHLWPGLLPGGYVGVDVFFVISGYLITSMLLREIETTGRVDLPGFYLRRVRRLAPAAILVLAFSLAVTVFVLPPVLWRLNAGHIGAASVYGLNWVLELQGVDYLAQSDSPSLVQHYWSLGVEEQFYVLWPAIVVVAGWLGRRFLGRLRIGLGAAFLAVGGLSFLICLAATGSQPSAAYFGTRARAWEFALGGLVALLPAAVLPARAGMLAAWSGVAAVLGADLVLDGSTAFPGWAALLPTAGTALALAVGTTAAASAGSFARVVEQTPLPWLGDHSYGVYLWHWPLIIAVPWVTHAPLDPAERIAIAAASLVLARWTKIHVEDPVRFGAFWRASWVPASAVAVTGALALVTGSAVVSATYSSWQHHESAVALDKVADHLTCYGAPALLHAGCRRPFAAPGQETIAFAATDAAQMQHHCQMGPTQSGPPTWCSWRGAAHPTATIAVVGNSFGIQLVPMLQEWVGHRAIRLLVAARTDCLGLSTTAVAGQRSDDPCVTWSAQVQQRLLHQPGLTGVVFADHEDSARFLTGQDSPGSAARTQAAANVVRSLRRFEAAGIATLVVKHPPGPMATSVPLCLAMSTASYDPCRRSRAAVTRMDLLWRTASAHPEATRLLSLDRFFCDTRHCHTTIGSVVAYKDDEHITAVFSRTLAQPLADRLAPLIAAGARVRQVPDLHTRAG